MTKIRSCNEARIVGGVQFWTDAPWNAGTGADDSVIAVPMIIPVKQFKDLNGNVYPYGKLWCYAAGTNDLENVYQDEGLTIPHPNPVVFDQNGMATIFLGPHIYKFVLQAMSGYVQWEQDDVAGSMWMGQMLAFAVVTPAVGADGRGHQFNSTLNEAAQGSHTLFANVIMQAPVVCLGPARVAEATTLFIAGVPTGATTNFAIRIAGPGFFGGEFVLSQKQNIGGGAVATMGKVGPP